MRRAEGWLVLVFCAAFSLVALDWSWRIGAMLNYGDAVAHLHIARRVFDSRHAWISQLGSVWLPLPHLLLMPFVTVYAWWANGLAAVIPSSLAWLASCFGVYRLARRWLSPAAAWIALAFFATNPNLLYMQTTAMTEPLFVCEMVWTALWLVEWRARMDTDAPRIGGLTFKIALMLIAAIFTRYDGWVMALLGWTAMGVVLLRRKRLGSVAYWIATVLVLAAPALWFWYNQVDFGDWLGFLRGPYSAKAIELRTALRGGPPHPGWHDPWMSLLFFVKAAEMDAAALGWNNPLLITSLIGTAWAWLIARRHAFLWWSMILWLPAPFYAYSVAYGSVPIFLPVWWPHSYYNTRYGLELLPALALGVGFAAGLILTAAREWMPRLRSVIAILLFVPIGLNAAEMVRQLPLVYVEGTKNINARRPYEENIPQALRDALASRPGAPVLMVTSVYPEIVALSGIRLKQTINEGDSELWRAALEDPAKYAAVVLAFDGDAVAQAVQAHPEGLRVVRRFKTQGQPAGTLYVSDTWQSTESSTARTQ